MSGVNLRRAGPLPVLAAVVGAVEDEGILFWIVVLKLYAYHPLVFARTGELREAALRVSYLYPLRPGKVLRLPRFAAVNGAKGKLLLITQR